MFFGEMLRKLEEIDRRVETLEHESLRYCKTRIGMAKRYFNYYKQKIDDIPDEQLGDDDIRQKVNLYVCRMEEELKNARLWEDEANKLIDEIEKLKAERTELIKKIRHYEGIETTREPDMLDYELMIIKTGFIHGTKL